MVSTVGNYDKKDGMDVRQEVSEISVCSITCVNQVKKRDSRTLKAGEKGPKQPHIDVKKTSAFGRDEVIRTRPRTLKRRNGPQIELKWSLYRNICNISMLNRKSLRVGPLVYVVPKFPLSIKRKQKGITALDR